MIFWSLVMVDVLVARRGRGCATLTSSTPAAALVEPQLTPTVRLSRDFCRRIDRGCTATVDKDPAPQLKQQQRPQARQPRRIAGAGTKVVTQTGRVGRLDQPALPDGGIGEQLVGELFQHVRKLAAMVQA